MGADTILYSREMAADPRDDFGVLEGTEHLLFGLADPYAVIRREVVRYLAQTEPELELERIECLEEPKWLTATRRLDPSNLELTVSGFGLCVPATLTFGSGYGSEQARSTITILCARWHEPAREVIRAYVDLGLDADAGYTDDAFRARLDVFRTEMATPDDLR